MKGLFGPDERRIRLDTIRRQIEESKISLNFINYDKFIFEIQMRWGLTESKAREMLDLVMNVLGANKDFGTGEIVFTKQHGTI